MNQQASFKFVGDCVLMAGDLTRLTVSALIKKNLPSQVQQHEVKLDLAELSGIDTSGLAWIISFIADVQKRGKTITILNPPEQLLKLAEISDLVTLLPLEKTAE